jgi:hypothetical protein
MVSYMCVGLTCTGVSTSAGTHCRCFTLPDCCCMCFCRCAAPACRPRQAQESARGVVTSNALHDRRAGKRWITVYNLDDPRACFASSASARFSASLGTMGVVTVVLKCSGSLGKGASCFLLLVLPPPTTLFFVGAAAAAAGAFTKRLRHGAELTSRACQCRCVKMVRCILSAKNSLRGYTRLQVRAGTCVRTSVPHAFRPVREVQVNGATRSNTHARNRGSAKAESTFIDRRDQNADASHRSSCERALSLCNKTRRTLPLAATRLPCRSCPEATPACRGAAIRPSAGRTGRIR